LTAWKIVTLVAAYPKVKASKDHWALAFQSVYDEERGLGAGEVRVAARAVTLDYLKSMKADRTNLTRLMDRPAEVPGGLDLDFARSLNPTAN
jgi:hypothetical protein